MQRSNTPTILPRYLSKELLDKNLIEIPTHITESMDNSSDSDLSIDKKTSRIILKIKKYYVICIWNRNSMNFDMSEMAAKNILTYGVFNKENWEQKAKKCGYRYLDQVPEN